MSELNNPQFPYSDGPVFCQVNGRATQLKPFVAALVKELKEQTTEWPTWELAFEMSRRNKSATFYQKNNNLHLFTHGQRLAVFYLKPLFVK